MGDNYGIASPWSDVDAWSLTSGGVSKVAIPLSEPVYLDHASADMTLDIADAPAGGALSKFDMTGYRMGGNILTMGANTIDVNGDVHLCSVIDGDAGAEIQCSGHFEKDITVCVLSDNVNILLDGTGDVTCNSKTGGKVEVDAGGGTHTAVESGYTAEWYSFTLTGGTYDDGGIDHNIETAISLAGGTLTSTGKWTLTASGTVLASTYTRTMAELAIPTGVEAELTGNTYTKKITAVGTARIHGAGELRLYQPTAAWWNVAATVSFECDVNIFRSSAEPGADIVLADANLLFGSNSDRTITMTHDIDIGAGGSGGVLTLGATVGKKYTLDINGSAFTGKQMIIGDTNATTGSGIFHCGEGTITVGAGGIARGHASNNANEFHFDSARILSSGDINLAGFTAITNVGAKVIGGTLTNVVVTGARLNATQGVTDGGGNSNVRFKGGASPTSTATSTTAAA